MADFLSRLLADPRKAIDAASITRVDELGNGYDDWNNLIAPKFEQPQQSWGQPQQSWGETALGVATAPARLATALAGSASPYGPDGWQVPPVAQEGWNALTAVGDAYTQGMSEDEMRNRALGMASFMFAGGGPAMALEKSLAPRPVSVRGYHGTRSEFDKFNGPSVFASENPDAASEWAMVANREGGGPNVLPLDITASNPYYAKSLFPDQAERDRIVRADPDVVFYPPSTQHGTTFDTHPGRVFEARKPGTIRSATTGETLFANSDSRPALLASALGQEQRGITGWHASPYDFDQFDLSQVGSGSGGQFYGRGVSLSDSPEISGKGGQYYNEFQKSHGQAKAYEVNVNADPNSLLDWDAPFSQQPEVVRKFFEANPPPPYYSLEGKPIPLEDYTGEMLFKGLGDGASDTMLQSGVPGVKYLDGGPRFGQGGPTNYNIFDPSSIEILKKYGLASALGQEQIDPERIKAAIRNRMRGDK